MSESNTLSVAITLSRLLTFRKVQCWMSEKCIDHSTFEKSSFTKFTVKFDNWLSSTFVILEDVFRLKKIYSKYFLTYCAAMRRIALHCAVPQLIFLWTIFLYLGASIIKLRPSLNLVYAFLLTRIMIVISLKKSKTNSMVRIHSKFNFGEYLYCTALRCIAAQCSAISKTSIIFNAAHCAALRRNALHHSCFPNFTFLLMKTVSDN